MGEVIIVRYADDFVVGFQHQADAQRFLRDLRKRLEKFMLTLRPDKTRLIEFGRFAIANRQKRGAGNRKSSPFWVSRIAARNAGRMEASRSSEPPWPSAWE